MSKRILDIGASDNPDKRATDAVDIEVSINEAERAKKKSPKLTNYYESDFRHPPEELKHEFDGVVSHFSMNALQGKLASKALDFVTKDNATAEIETNIGEATEIVQTLHDANFKTLSVEAKEIPAIAPALGDIAGKVVIKAIKKKRSKEKSPYPMPIKLTLPYNRQRKKVKDVKVARHRRHLISRNSMPTLRIIR